MRRSSDRGQVEPLAALAAVLAVSAALVVYVGALDDAMPGESDSKTPRTIHDRVQRHVTSAGVVDPDRLAGALETVPDGWTANVTVAGGGMQWHRGPDPPDEAERVRSRVSVAIGPGRVEPGQLRVVVWR